MRGELGAAFRTGRPLGHVTRGLIAVASMFLNFAALARLPLVDATAISFAAPFITVALAVLVLKERGRGLSLDRGGRRVYRCAGASASSTAIGLRKT